MQPGIIIPLSSYSLHEQEAPVSQKERSSARSSSQRQQPSSGSGVNLSESQSSRPLTYNDAHQSVGSSYVPQILQSQALHSAENSASKLSLPQSSTTSALLPSVPETRPTMDLTLVISLIQELIMLSSSKAKHVIPKTMALLCSKLDLTWACLTAFSLSGQHYQHCGAAHALQQERLLLSHPGFLACMENGGVSAGSGERYSHNSNSGSREEGSEALRDSIDAASRVHPPTPVRGCPLARLTQYCWQLLCLSPLI